MSRRRLPVLLLAALFFSTLALANSIPVHMAFLHSGAGVLSGAVTHPSHFSTSAGRATPMNYDAINVNSHASAEWNTHLSGLSSGKVLLAKGSANTTGHIAFPGRGYEPTCCKAQNWVGGDYTGHTTAPEPGSLILLSTGLLGIAGLVRRKLLRG